MPGRFFDRLPDRRAVCIIPQARGRGEQQVFELAQHDYYYIVMSIIPICQDAVAGSDHLRDG